MTQPGALDFIQALQTDTALRMKATQLHPDDIDGLIDIATMHGYLFSRKEWVDAVHEFHKRQPVVAEHGSLSRVPGFNSLT